MILIFGENYSDKIPLLEVFLKEKKINYDIKKLTKELSEEKEKVSLNFFEKKIINSDRNITIDEVDLMNGYEFEDFLAKLFKNLGYDVTQSKYSNDQGGDLVIKKFGKKTVIQAKRYNTPVGNKAVQEVFSAINFYNADAGMVVTNNVFTDQAVELAKLNNIKLTGREELTKLIKDYG